MARVLDPESVKTNEGICERNRHQKAGEKIWLLQKVLNKEF